MERDPGDVPPVHPGPDAGTQECPLHGGPTRKARCPLSSRRDLSLRPSQARPPRPGRDDPEGPAAKRCRARIRGREGRKQKEEKRLDSKGAGTAFRKVAISYQQKVNGFTRNLFGASP